MSVYIYEVICFETFCSDFGCSRHEAISGQNVFVHIRENYSAHSIQKYLSGSSDFCQQNNSASQHAISGQWKVQQL